MSTAVLLWVWFFAYLNCAGRTLQALHPLHAADSAAGHPAHRRVRPNSPHRKTRSAAEAGFQFEAGVEHEHVCPEDTSADLKRQGIEYVLVREEVLKEGFNCSLDDWLKRMNARVVQKIPLNLRASKGALDWYLVQLR